MIARFTESCKYATIFHFMVTSLCLLSSCCANLSNLDLSDYKDESGVQPGCVIYGYGGRKIQCLAEKDKTGKVFIQLQSLDDPHTTIEFKRIACFQDQSFLVSGVMVIDNPDTPLASCAHRQAFDLQITPTFVETSTLTGQGQVVHQTASLLVTIAK